MIAPVRQDLPVSSSPFDRLHTAEQGFMWFHSPAPRRAFGAWYQNRLAPGIYLRTRPIHEV